MTYTRVRKTGEAGYRESCTPGLQSCVRRLSLRLNTPAIRMVDVHLHWP
jgi:hypothetical protein